MHQVKSKMGVKKHFLKAMRFEPSSLGIPLDTHDCVTLFNSSRAIKLADNTTVICLITNDNETAYRREVENLER